LNQIDEKEIPQGGKGSISFKNAVLFEIEPKNTKNKMNKKRRTFFMKAVLGNNHSSVSGK